MTAAEIRTAISEGRHVIATQASGMERTVRLIGELRQRFGQWEAEVRDDTQLVTGRRFEAIDITSVDVVDD